MRVVPASVLLALLLGFFGSTLLDGGPAGRPLDLPSGGRGADEEQDEDAPEVIVFYGAEFESDAFFWCLDRSGSMSGHKIVVLKEELTGAIDQLSRQAEFGIVAYNGSVIRFSEAPVRARRAEKTRAREWVNELLAHGSTRLAAPSAEILRISQLSRKKNKRIIMVGDAAPQDADAAISTIEDLNHESTPFDCLLISGISDLFEEIAAMTGGTFRVLGP